MRAPLSAATPVRAIPPGVTLRPLAPGDGDRLGALMAAAYRGTVEDQGESADWHVGEAHRCLAGAFGTVVWSVSVVAVAASADGPVGASPVPQDGPVTGQGSLIGASVVTQDGPHLLLAFALVAPSHQGRGLGSTLLSHSAAVLLAAGHDEWTLAIADGNPARRLYARLGFVVDESLRAS